MQESSGPAKRQSVPPEVLVIGAVVLILYAIAFI
jgi:hypothetical protein